MERAIWSELAQGLRASDAYRALRRLPARATGLPVPAAAWLAGLVGAEQERPLLIVLPREGHALAWVESNSLLLPERPAVHFSAPSLTPYQETEISLSVRAQEVEALAALRTGRAAAVVCTPQALFRRLPSPAAFGREVLALAEGEEWPIELLLEHLVRFGYHRREVVSETGEIAVRGGIVDVYPPGGEPIRLDFFGDTIESIRPFDPDSQRSEKRNIEVAELLPLALFPQNREAAVQLANRLLELGAGETYEAASEIEGLRAGQGRPGWQNALPLLAEETVTLDAWLDDALVVVMEVDRLRSEAEHHAERLRVDYDIRSRQGRAVAAPDRIEHEIEDVLAILDRNELQIGGLGKAPIDFRAQSTDLFHGQLPRFPHEVAVAARRGERLLIVTPEDHRQRLVELLEAREVPLGSGGAELVEGELERGFRLPDAGVAIYSEQQLFPRVASEQRLPRARYGPFVSSLRDLHVGDHVVHLEHGIGRFVGLRRLGSSQPAARPELPPALQELDQSAGESEVMEIAYAQGKTLLLPLTRLDQIQKYSGLGAAAPRLDQLGGTSWAKTKSRVKKGLRQLAGNLLKLYAERQLAEAPVMPEDGDLQRQFELAFEHDETPDQVEAVAAIKEDLQQKRPMDRLLCGDVGFGKTEVAMRAAFKVVEAGHQVAVLAPTTILADQHLDTFRKRFDGFPIKIDMISRFRSQAEIRQVREAAARGHVDVLIGTHRLLSKDVELPRLGLLVVDEEQRFGVAQKERYRELRRSVHVLALSATPVPRTLQLSLAGVRELSVIETPPRNRMSIETAIVPFTPELVREAIDFEVGRGGQVYYVFNHVDRIEEMARYLREIVPNLRITWGHGQMDERELSRRMHAFTDGEYDLLLASTIIENGIDIPNVNTMIVHQADHFGLSQLYQLRGRVGRSHQLAFCYLLVGADRVLSDQARKRLDAIREFSALGSGFRIAARDLEIRGAGNLLGSEQSGHIADLGIETYLKMLDETVRELKGEEVEETVSVAMDLPVPSAIPEDYIRDANLRMEVYRKLVSGDVADEEILDELRDRFGTPPEAVGGLLEVAGLKRLAERLRVQSISLRGKSLHIRLRRDARIDVDRLIELMSERPDINFSPSGVLTLQGDGKRRVVGLARETLEELAG